MSLKNRLSDSFVTGLFIGGGTLVLFYVLINWIRLFLISQTGNELLLKPPAVQLYSVVLNVILFRMVMVKMEKEQTAKGILFVTVICLLAYFIFYRMKNPS